VSMMSLLWACRSVVDTFPGATSPTAGPKIPPCRCVSCPACRRGKPDTTTCPRRRAFAPTTDHVARLQSSPILCDLSIARLPCCCGAESTQLCWSYWRPGSLSTPRRTCAGKVDLGRRRVEFFDSRPATKPGRTHFCRTPVPRPLRVSSGGGSARYSGPVRESEPSCAVSGG